MYDKSELDNKKLESKSDNIVLINRFRMSKINYSIHIFSLCLTITTLGST